MQGISLALLAGPALAETPSTLSPCEDYRSSAHALAEPWEENTATFAEGMVRIAVVDTGEPAARAFHLVVLHPSGEPEGYRACTLISDADGSGFAGLSLVGIRSAYDPAAGLTVTLPAVLWADGDVYTETTLSVSVNQATGEVKAFTP